MQFIYSGEIDPSNTVLSYDYLNDKVLSLQCSVGLKILFMVL